MNKVEIEVRTNGKPKDPWYTAYMTVEWNEEKMKVEKRYFVKREEIFNDGETVTTMIKEYKTRNALKNFMRTIPNN